MVALQSQQRTSGGWFDVCNSWVADAIVMIEIAANSAGGERTTVSVDSVVVAAAAGDDSDDGAEEEVDDVI